MLLPRAALDLDELTKPLDGRINGRHADRHPPAALDALTGLGVHAQARQRFVSDDPLKRRRCQALGPLVDRLKSDGRVAAGRVPNANVRVLVAVALAWIVRVIRVHELGGQHAV